MRFPLRDTSPAVDFGDLAHVVFRALAEVVVMAVVIDAADVPAGSSEKASGGR